MKWNPFSRVPKPGTVYDGPLCWSTEHGAPAHFAMIDGKPNFKHRLIWIDDDPMNPDPTPGAHYEYWGPEAGDHLTRYHRQDKEMVVSDE